MRAGWRKGQNTVEYMLFISVIAIAMVIAANSFAEAGYMDGLESFQDHINSYVEDGVVGNE